MAGASAEHDSFAAHDEGVVRDLQQALYEAEAARQEAGEQVILDLQNACGLSVGA